MSIQKDLKNNIINDILKTIDSDKSDVVKYISHKYSLSRQTINKYIKKLISDGVVEASGKGRGVKYSLKTIVETFITELDKIKHDEDLFWRDTVYPVLPKLPINILNICSYGFTEILNNVFEHSNANGFTVTVKYNAAKIEFTILDDGVGIFNKIKNDFNLEDPKHSILELAKGKLTSDPDNHTGEGIFFTSRAFDKFIILSYGLYFSGHKSNDWLMELKTYIKGTLVIMKIDLDSKVQLKDIFNEYATSEDFGFSKTNIPVVLLDHEGGTLVSRSQAKRLITRFDRFKEVVLDFEGIEMIGQGFADELFRVFANEHPDVHLFWVNANEDILNMIKHVMNAK